MPDFRIWTHHMRGQVGYHVVRAGGTKKADNNEVAITPGNNIFRYSEPIEKIVGVCVLHDDCDSTFFPYELCEGELTHILIDMHNYNLDAVAKWSETKTPRLISHDGWNCSHRNPIEKLALFLRAYVFWMAMKMKILVK